MEVKVQCIERGGRRPSMPRFATAGAAAADLSAFLDEPIVLQPGQRRSIPTGLCIELPVGYCAFVMARSGLSLKAGIALANGVGLIDSDYRGEIGVSLINLSAEPFIVEDGMRVAQLLVMQLPAVTFAEADTLSATERGAGGFGSTGIKGE